MLEACEPVRETDHFLGDIGRLGKLRVQLSSRFRTDILQPTLRTEADLVPPRNAGGMKRSLIRRRAPKV